MTLAIVTVSFGHKTLLMRNRALVEFLNPSAIGDIEWHVVENSPSNYPDRFLGNEAGFIFHDIRGESGQGISQHHATALNQLLRRVGNKNHILILDPDFYVLARDWIRHIPEYMAQKGLSFFGVPWHPRANQNYRYFPAVHCFFFDSSKVRPADLDFTPKLELLAQQNSLSWKVKRAIPIVGYRITSLSWDTGSKVYDRFGRDMSHRSEIVTPIHNSNPLARSAKNRMIELFLPESLHLEPGKPNYFTEVTFQQRGWMDTMLPAYWESFVWRDLPFGLHARCSYSAHTRDREMEINTLFNILDTLCPGTISEFQLEE